MRKTILKIVVVVTLVAGAFLLGIRCGEENRTPIVVADGHAHFQETVTTWPTLLQNSALSESSINTDDDFGPLSLKKMLEIQVLSDFEERKDGQIHYRVEWDDARKALVFHEPRPYPLGVYFALECLSKSYDSWNSPIDLMDSYR
jgi:hypothetical protein